MSGPSLKKQDAHSSIHEAALTEARELREIFKKSLEKGEAEEALQVAEIIIEHWESRTLKHAESEEEGLYKELVQEDPDVIQLVNQLTRDHDLMRRIVGEMNELLINNEMNIRMLSLMDALIIIDSIHNEDEMNKLLIRIKQ